MIHCRVSDIHGNWLYWLTAIYGQNQIEDRKRLWRQLVDTHRKQQGPWMLMGDFNNVLKCTNRIGGRQIKEDEYRDLQKFMEEAI